MARTEVLKSFVSPEEKIKAEQIAAAEGLTVSAYIRRCFILATPRKPAKRQAA